MKKRLGLLFLAGMIALLIGAIYVMGFADHTAIKSGTETSQGIRDTKLNHTYCWKSDSSTTHVPSYADYPADLIALEEVEADTSVSFDLHHYKEMVTIFCVTDRNADTGHVDVKLEVSLDGDSWVQADSVIGSGADSTFYVKDWSVPAGAMYGRLIYQAQMASGKSTSVNQISHCCQQ